jgi:polyhydroxybutyrate depolymerase
VRRPFFFLSAAAALSTLSVPPLTAQVRPTPFARQTWTVNGVERSAVVAVPVQPAPKTGVPLVLVFHGHGGTADHSARMFLMHPHWADALVIYAQGLPTPGRLTDPEGAKPGWQSRPADHNDPDLKYVDAIIAWAKTKFRIDPARIYAAGHSNGGTMTYVLWAARPDVFAAFAASGSVFRKELIASAKPKPALIIAGEKDQLVPFALQEVSLAAVLRLNGASRSSVPYSHGVVLHKSTSGADVGAYIYPGDHTMPANAGELMVKFFKDHAQSRP